ncbi:ATP-dependent DNA helicase DDX11 [Neocloeon triangulifer]|uniref:ATP-dependent DNA helicase DDX11 n=1 Tax=Neocloeon triangulifer TaxID=2078957 RepID=UPI00286F01AE|nr:ATP-dependent DNA helicase DDX11 [Neocloeon triangulifer]
MEQQRCDFPFPFIPYDNQSNFMKSLYSVLQNGSLAIMESPTGTGKSMSLICGAVAWLKDFEEAEMKRLETKANSHAQETTSSNSSDDWFNDQFKLIGKKHEADKAKKALREIQEQLQQISLYPNELKKFKELEELRQRNRTVPNKFQENKLAKEQHILDSDLLLVDGETELSDEEDEEDVEKARLPKIIYCSRTHSQLAQFVSEIKKSPYSKDLRVVTLGSRQNYCINEEVVGLKNSNLINERCLQLRQNKSSTKPSGAKRQKRENCPFSCNSNGMKFIRMSAMTEVLDMEDLVQIGRKEDACPYYATKASVDDAQVIIAPYNILLLKESREAYGLNLKGNVIIIDEAHNLLETESSIHSTEVNLVQLTCAHSQLAQYLEKYKTKLAPANLLKIRQLLQVITRLTSMIGDKSVKSEKVFTMNEFLNKSELADFNLLELVNFTRCSRLAQKLNGFTIRFNPTLEPPKSKKDETTPKTGFHSFLNKVNKKNADTNPPAQEDTASGISIIDSGVGINPILPVLNLMNKLTCQTESGRVLCLSGQHHSLIKFVLLNPGSMFADIVAEARAVVLAGGTMKPTWDVRHELFNDSERIVEHFFGHVVPAENVLPLVLSNAPYPCEFDFSFQSRNNREMIKALGRTLSNISSVVPHGIVVFFPSHKYLDQVYRIWREESVDESLEKCKKLFKEPDTSSQVDQVLKEYAAICKPPGNGAMLLSVVGGRLSEGINFSDELCRCVIVVGLPYPNIKSLELQAKMEYQRVKFKSVAEGKDPASEYYNNLCMKAVNQCIGRAIRHQNDYAAMVLLDKRYKSPHVRSALPSWIENNLSISKDFGSGFSMLRKFFFCKKTEAGGSDQK